MVPNFEKVVATGDRYGLHAYLTALENADLLQQLKNELRAGIHMDPEKRVHLETIVSSGSLSTGEMATGTVSSAAARS
jgi:hypothetical protein